MNEEFKQTKVLYSEYVNFDETGHGKLSYVALGNVYGMDDYFQFYSLHHVEDVVYNKELSGIEDIEVTYYREVNAKTIIFDRDNLMEEFKLEFFNYKINKYGG